MRNVLKYFFNMVIFIPLRIVAGLLSPLRRKKASERILLVFLHYIGDVVMITPVIEAIAQHNPTIKIEAWINSTAVDILRGNPHVSRILVDAAPQAKYNHLSGILRRFWLNRHNLVSLGFHPVDTVIDFSAFFDSAVFSRIASAGQTIGFTAHDSMNIAYSQVIKRHPSTMPLPRLYLQAVRIFGIDPAGESDRFSLYISDDHRNVIKQFLAGSSQKLIVIAPFAGWQNKVWPLSRFVEVGRYCAEQFACPVFYIGGLADQAVMAAALTGCDTHQQSLCGRLSILESAALLEKTDLFIGLDSAMAKIASAFDIPSVVIYGGTNPALSAPSHNSHCIVLQTVLECSAQSGNEYCGNGTMTYQCPRSQLCMERIAVTTVSDAVIQLVPKTLQTNQIPKDLPL